MTKKEEALRALGALLAGVAEALSMSLGPVAFARNPDEEVRFEPNDVGKIVLRDGTTGEPDVSLSPPAYEYEHTARIVIAVAKRGPVNADEAFDRIVDAIGASLDPEADPPGDLTLGGVVDLAELGSLDTDEIDDALERDFKAAVIPARLTYVTTRPLG